uniref:Uncharacterized protein n=1 Tax=Utricularia reniformis TaxID=192314 RepID=A0A1Y0B072_9LAMI|nr:hypothetical protein AEK19_MT0544 [Utricularia reniformis]ART30800.1 hypothetical protein AEK19_MT0544 [Utricularia reniformis]
MGILFNTVANLDSSGFLGDFLRPSPLLFFWHSMRMRLTSDLEPYKLFKGLSCRKLPTEN